MPLYHARLSVEEIRLLESVLGKTLDSVASDAWSVACCAGGQVLRFLPEEIATPDATHAHAEVVRVRVELSDALRPGDKVIARDLGEIVDIGVQSVLLRFTPPRHAPPTELRGVVIPEGIEFGPEFLSPKESAAMDASLAVAHVDVIVALYVASGPMLIGSDSIGYFIHTSAKDEGRERLQFPSGAIVERRLADAAESLA